MLRSRSLLSEDYTYARDTQSALLCSGCLQIFRTKASKEKKPLHAVSKSLARSISKNCHICLLLAEKIESQKIEVTYKDQVSPRKKQYNADQPLGIFYEIELSPTPKIKFSSHAGELGWVGLLQVDAPRSVFLKIPPKEDSAMRMRQIEDIDCLGLDREPVDQTISPRSLNLAQNWLRRCVICHDCSKVGAGQPSSYNPTWLIQVGQSPRLVRGSTLPAGLQYVALSYPKCPNTICLQSSTAAAFQEIIPVADLPLGIQDVFTLVSSLELDYLWYDSLCILQDSKEDKQRGNSEKGIVYSQCFLNIALTGSRDITQSLHYERGLGASVKNAEVRPTWEIPFFDKRSRACKIIDLNHWSMGVEETPLYQKSSTLQERFLSPRTLYVGNEQLFWECSECARSELWPENLPRIVEKDDLKLLARCQRDCDTWLRVVAQYTRGNFEVEPDRLRGLSGIVELLRHHIGGEYHAGLWGARIVQQLCWYVDHDSTRASYRLQQYCAPSWSWACVTGPISYRVWDDVEFKHDTSSVASLTNIFVTQEGPVGLVSVTHGCIDLSGYIKLVSWKDLPQILHTQSKVSCRFSNATLCASISFDAFRPGTDLVDIRLPPSTGPHAISSVNNQERVAFLPLHETIVGLSGDVLQGIIMRRTGNWGEYHRIGWFCVTKELSEKDHKIPNPWEKYHGRIEGELKSVVREAKIEDGDCLDYVGGGCYKVMIV